MAGLQAYIERGGLWVAVGRNAIGIELATTLPAAANSGLAVKGISAGNLTVHSGDWTISTPGTYEGYLVKGLVTITASNVTFRKSLVVSRPNLTNASYNGGMIMTSGSNVLIENCELTAWTTLLVATIPYTG